MNNILLVDDEQNVLNALRRELKDHFNIETFCSPVAALERCKETKFDLVIADYKMPEMTGLEFLKQFNPLQPDAARLVLSGEADIDALIRTINETHIYRFLSKPWNKEELYSCISQALTYREAILENRRKTDTNRVTAAKRFQEGTPYRIVLVESDSHLLSIKAQGLSDESGHESLYGAMQQEIKQANQSRKIKCNVDAFSTGSLALEHVANNPCDLIISAQTLTDMEGIQLLSKMKQIVPDAARILISSDPDKMMISQAINEAEVQNVLPLHWSSYERGDARRRGWNLYQLKSAAIQALAARELQLGL